MMAPTPRIGARRLALGLAGMALAATAIAVAREDGTRQATTPGRGRKVLVVWGGWENHEPKKCVDLFVPWLTEQGFDVEVSSSLDVYADPARTKSLALIVQSVTLGNLSGAQEKGLLEAVQGGTGLAGWHGGITDSFRSNPAYELMVGGSFAAHPGGIIDYDVRFTRRDDPITKGLTDFRMRSEQYYVLVDPAIEVLATTTFTGQADPAIQGTVMPVVWRKLYGKGRVFSTTLGHVAADFAVPQAREIVQRGMLWAARVPGAGDDPRPANPYR
jgi:hypothetical protein